MTDQSLEPRPPIREEVVQDMIEKGFSFETATEEECREVYRRVVGHDPEEASEETA